MKTVNHLKALVIPVLLATLSFTFISCEKDNDIDDPENTYTLSGNASGSQEVPAVTTTATGNLSGTYNDRTNTLTYNITWTGLSNVVTNIHFHGPAMVGAEAGPLHHLTITTNGVSGTSTGTLVLDESHEDDLINGRIYYNIHTALNPDGEIRGQVTATAN